MATAVISEFNPFHNGHGYLLRRAKELSPQPIIAIMSGSFTQRGEVAVCSKFWRAKAAVENGADLVVELPTVYATAGARQFAMCGLEIAKSFSAVNKLAFGCECDDIEQLLNAAGAQEQPEVRERLLQLMKGGDYYPRAYEQAVREVLGESTAEVLSYPNNTLAVEYLRHLGEKIEPLAVKRKGAQHDSEKTSAGIASASYIRGLLRSGKDVRSFMPSVPGEITFPKNLDRPLIYRLRSMSASQAADLPEVGEGLENRILSAAKKAQSADELADMVKTKRYTHARIRRILTSALLGITKSDRQIKPEYVRVLAFNSRGADLLKTTSFEVITSPAAAIKRGSKNTRLLKKDIFATDTAALAYESVKPAGADFYQSVIKTE